MKNLEASFKITLKAPVWKLLPDPDGNTFVLELRNAEQKFAAWVIININTVANSEPFYISPENAWDYTLTDFGNQTLILGKYEKGGMPVIDSYCAFDLKGNKLWEKKENEFSKSKHYSIQEILFSFPELVSIDDSEKRESLLRDFYPEIPVQQLHLLEFGNYRILSGYLKNNGSFLTHKLKIFLKDSLVYEDVIDHQLKRFSFDNWGVYKNQLFYIQDQTTFISVRLIP